MNDQRIVAHWQRKIPQMMWSLVVCLALCVGVFMEPLFQGGAFSGSVVQAAKQGKKQEIVWPTLSDSKQRTLSCGSAIVMELSTGLILYQHKMHRKAYPASITKILTAMLTAENTTPNEILTVSTGAAYGISPGDSTVFSEPGEKLTIEECLYAIMLQSANEVCLAVGEHVSGSVSSFVDLMNQRVKELGLKDTHFNNPNGLPDTKHYTSAYDMAVIARTAMKNDLFRKVTGTKAYTCPKTNKHKEERYWPNHHQMINAYTYPKYAYKYCTGGKTGFTQAAGSTLVTYAEKDGMELVCVVMKAASPKNSEWNEYTDTTTLLNFGFENYQKYSASETKESISSSLFNTYGSYFDMKHSPVHLSEESSVVLPKRVKLSKAKQTITYQKNKKLTDGENVIGHVKYTYGKKTVGFSDILYTKGDTGQKLSLDAASRKIMGKEIDQMEETQKAEEKNATFWRNVKGVIKTAWGFLAVKIVSGIMALLLLITLFLLIRKNFHMPQIHLPRRRARRRERGSRSTREKKKYRRRSRQNSVQYYESQKPSAPRSQRRSGLQYGKKHRKTRESFGRSLFDFEDEEEE